MWEKIIKRLIENTPLALIVIGVFLFLLCAAGGSDKIGFVIDDTRWRVALTAMGVLVASFGALLIWRTPANIETSALADEYGLKIREPEENSEVSDKIQLKGTYKKKPPIKNLAVLEFSPSSGQYWFKKPPPLYNEKDKAWSFTDVWIGGGRGEDRVLYLAILGEAGKALKDLYYAANEPREHGNWIGVKTLTPDIVFCAQVKVHRKPTP